MRDRRRIGPIRRARATRLGDDRVPVAIGPRTQHRRWPAMLLMVLVLLASGLVSTPPAVAAPPADFQTSLVVGDGLDGPTGFEIAPDGRIFVLERAGKIKVIKNGQLLSTPF